MGKAKETWNPYRQVMQLSQNGGLGISLPNALCRKLDIRKGQIVKLEEVSDLTQECAGLFLRLVRMSDVGECRMPIELSSTKPTANPGGKG
jgi:hypothetical protein